MNNFSKRQHKNKKMYTINELRILFSLLALSFTSCLYISQVFPYFPPFAKQRKLSQTKIGVVIGCYQFFILLTGFIFGKIMTKTGYKLMLILGSFVTAICACLFGILEWCPPGTTFLVMCILVRSFESIATSASSIATNTVITQLTDINFVMGIQHAAVDLGLFVGPPMGGSIYTRYGYYAVFVIPGCIYGITSLICIFTMPKLERIQNTQPNILKDDYNIDENNYKTFQRKSTWFTFTNTVSSTVIALCIVQALIQLTNGFYEVSYAEHLEKFNLTHTQTGGIFSITPAIQAICYPLFGYIADKTNKSFIILLAGLLLRSFSLLFLGNSPIFNINSTVVQEGIALAFAAIGYSSMVTVFGQLKKSFAVRSEIVSATYITFNAFGAFVGPLFGGFISDRMTFGSGSTLMVGISLLACVIWIVVNLFEKIQLRRRTRYEILTNVDE